MTQQNLILLLETYLHTATATDLDFNNQDIFNSEWLEDLFVKEATRYFNTLTQEELEECFSSYEVETIEEVVKLFCGWESALYCLRKWIGYEQLVYQAEMDEQLDMEKMVKALGEEDVLTLLDPAAF